VRVLTVGNRPPDPSAGGYEVVWADLVAGLEARGHTAGVLHPPALPTYWRDGRFARPSALAARRLDRAARSALAATIADEQPDVVVWLNLGGLPLSLLGVTDLPQVGLVHDGWMLYGQDTDRWHSILRRRLAPDRGLWLFNSRYALDRTLERVPLAHVDVITPGVDPALFAPAQAPAQWSGRLAIVGRVEEPKGTRVALDALPDDMSLTVTGPADPEYLDMLRAHPAAVRVTFADAVPRTALRDVYAAADAVLFPVTWPEPWGLVPLEAMSVGRPVVATGTGGSAEYLRDGVNCLLAAPGDAGGLADAVRRLAADPELRQRLVAGGRATAAEHQQARFVEQVCERIEESAARA
jgi:glycosyltransferase involved in cell wall biosynthesis